MNSSTRTSRRRALPSINSARTTHPLTRVVAAVTTAAMLIAGPFGCRTVQTRRNTIKSIAMRNVRTELELTSRIRRDKRDSKQATGDEKFAESIFQQRLRVEADGYVYHPNLLDFSLAFVGGLQQSKFDETLNNITRNSGQNDTLEEFDIRAKFFQNKDFPASVHAVRSRTFDPRPFRSSLETTTTSFDFTWQYVNPKTPTLVQLSRTNVDFSPFLRAGERPGNRQNTVARFETAYLFNEHNVLSLRANRESLQESPITLRYDTTRVDLDHRLDFGGEKQHRLDSTLRSFDQQGTFSIERFEWRETVRLKHTDRLRSWFEFQYIDRTQGSLSGVAPVKEQSYLVSGDLEHHLYESLTSRLEARVQYQDFGSGLKIERYTFRGSLKYQKKNRWGLLHGDYSVQFEQQDRTGGDLVVAVTEEPHSFRDPESIIITGSNINVATLRLIREDRTETFRSGRDYRVRNFANRIEIERVVTGRILDEETVLVSYQFTLGGNFNLGTVQQRLGMRQDFDFGLSAYYRLYLQTQTITPATSDGISVEDITAHTLGAEYRKGMFHLFTEVEDHASTVSPFRSFRIGGDYSRPIGDATASISALWSDVQYRDQTGRDVTLWTVDGRYRHPITRTLSVEGGVLYRKEQDTVGGDSDGIGFDLSTEWSFRTSEIRLTYEFNLFSDRFADDQSQALMVRFLRRF